MSNLSYTATAFTSNGYATFYNELISKAERVYILKGAPGTGKSTFLQMAGDELRMEGCEVDFIYSGEYGTRVDAIFVHENKILLINGAKPNYIEARYPGAVERMLDFSDFCDIDYLRKVKESIIYLVDEVSHEHDKLVSHMRAAKLIHDRWETEYLKGMDFQKADEITEALIKEFIPARILTLGEEFHRFSGALTADGQVSFYDNLTAGLQHRIIVKGRPGTGKSTMNRKLAAAAKASGYDVELYHCGFDANSIDMIVVRELGLAMLDGTAPHVVEPQGEDRLVDMFECIDQSVVNELENPILGITQEYAVEIGFATEAFRKIGQLNIELEKYYMDATDFNEVDALRARITKAILSLRE